MSWQDHLRAQHADRVDANRWRTRVTLDSPQAAVVSIDGRSFDNFCSNDYLGLANDPRLIDATQTAATDFGVGSGASHLICGHQAPHHQLELELASFMGAEQALIFSCGYMANLAIAKSFLGRDDFVFQDKLNHASLIDAGLACDAKLKRYAHNDMTALVELFKKNATGRKMIMTDGVFSMDGDVAPLSELKQISDAHDALLVIDEAHGFGVLGTGRGAAASECVYPKDNVLVMGTLGKAAGSFGAFVAGDALLIQHLIQFGRTYTYTTALPPHIAATSLVALQIIAKQTSLQSKLIDNVQLFKTELNKADPAMAAKLMLSNTAIQPLLVGDERTALEASSLLRENGILVLAIRPPTVPVGSSRLRLTITAAHEASNIIRLVDVLASDAMKSVMGQDSSSNASQQ
ncbi:8-amino-7-oxononanoate synthase [Mariniblastus sp.]|nr:8-amino-7-oxononanoate synthase [Mariniblastus sp.]